MKERSKPRAHNSYSKVFSKKNKFLPTLPSLLMDPEVPLIHRDISWLQFNERVLEQARPTSQNLPLERIKFLAISATNLDEFFMVRVASIKKEIQQAKNSPQKLAALTRTWELLLERVVTLGARQNEILDLLSMELKEVGIHLVTSAKMDDETYEIGKPLFEKKITPHLRTPTNFTSRHLSRLNNLHMGILFQDGLWFEVPANLPAVLVTKPSKNKPTYVFFLDLMLQAFMKRFFNQKKLPTILRVTRDADVTTELIEEGIPPTPENVRNCLQDIDSGKAIRLQYKGRLDHEVLEKSISRLGISPLQCFSAPGTLCLHGLWNLALNPPSKSSELLYSPLKSFVPEAFKEPKSLFERIRQKDILLHHPYDSFDAFLIWIQTACSDPNVRSIDLTVYRMGTLSPIVTNLKKAAKKGKKVRIFIELRARFDERNNILLSEELMAAGVSVHFGFGKLKMHAKAALVTRKEKGKKVLYTHLSTGNYNAKTAKLYTDLAIITANQMIGNDAQRFFRAVSSGTLPQGLKKIVTAPTNLHRRLLQLVDQEILAASEGKPARIVIKINALVDDEFIESLYRASESGVKVDLIVRGPCSLIPKVPGLSENIKVYSIVDRFLEHSRLYYFKNSRMIYLSSADAMPRNFYRRLELGFPILDPKIRDYITEVIIPIYLSDSVKARELTSQGIWKKRVPKKNNAPVRAQFLFQKLAENRYKNTPLNI